LFVLFYFILFVYLFDTVRSLGPCMPWSCSWYCQKALCEVRCTSFVFWHLDLWYECYWSNFKVFINQKIWNDFYFHFGCHNSTLVHTLSKLGCLFICFVLFCLFVCYNQISLTLCLPIAILVLLERSLPREVHKLFLWCLDLWYERYWISKICQIKKLL